MRSSEDRQRNGDEDVRVVSHFGSPREPFPRTVPVTYSVPEEADIHLHVSPGCLRPGQVVGPVRLQRKSDLVTCRGEVFLITEVMDCQPHGSKFEHSMHLDFGVGVGKMEDLEESGKGFSPGKDATSERERFKQHLLDIHKVRCYVSFFIGAGERGFIHSRWFVDRRFVTACERLRGRSSTEETRLTASRRTVAKTFPTIVCFSMTFFRCCAASEAVSRGSS